ncbi:MAG: ATP-dependent Clp protease adaptor ClpS [Planctomycetales bacterium]|nr:ATP-dependent Clp protease adaptor ClpS [Planctomycetales bacterium]
MSDESQTAVAEPETIVRPQRRRKSKPQRSQPKLLPPYAVVVHDDDVHTFEYVIETFMKVFGYSTEKSFILANTIHTEGRAIVWTGPKEVAELKRDLIRSAGPDLHAEKTVNFPLGVDIEPLPGG